MGSNAAENNLAQVVNAVEDCERQAQAPLSTLWDKLDSQVYRVVDEDGVNVYDAELRRIGGRWWLYVDSADGYTILDESEIARLLCVREELHQPCGWDRGGNVIDL